MDNAATLRGIKVHSEEKMIDRERCEDTRSDDLAELKFDRLFESSSHLAIDPVDLPVLILQFAAHVDRHVPQIADHRVHLAHIILHLVLAGVVCDLGDVTTLGAESVAIVHHPLGLVVNHLTVIVAFPRSLVFLEAGTSARTSGFIRKFLLERRRFEAQKDGGGTLYVSLGL